MSNDNDALSLGLGKRPAGFDEFVRELEAMGALDLEEALQTAEPAGPAPIALDRRGDAGY